MIHTIKKYIFNKTAGALALIIVLTCLAYANALTNSFIWDDFLLIVTNDFVHSWDNVPLLLSPEYITDTAEMQHLGETAIGSGELSYRPVNTLTFFLDYGAWGLNPFGFHLTNLLLHTANGILLFFFIRKISKNHTAAILTALLFTLHPVNSETVAVINFREDLLVVFFCLISFLIHLDLQFYPGIKRNLLYTLSLLAYALALFSKETAIMLPVLLFLYDHSLAPRQNPRPLSRVIGYYSGYIAITLVFLAIWFFPMASGPASVPDYFEGSTSTRIFTMTAVIFRYLAWLILPVDLHATIFDPSVLVHSALDFRFLRAGLVIVAILASSFYLWKRSRYAFFFTAWFFISLLPVMNILLMPNIYAARLLYLPAVGFCAIEGFLLAKIRIAPMPFLHTVLLKKMLKALPLIVLAFYIVLTFIGNFTWKDNLTLQLHMLRHYPDNPQIPFYLSDTLRDQNTYRQ